MKRRLVTRMGVALVAASAAFGASMVSSAATITVTQIGASIDGVADYDYTGGSVAISQDGSRVAIGGSTTDGNGSNSGQVRVYDWNGTAWVQAGADLNGEAANDRFGQSVAISADGDRIAVGANLNDDNGNEAGQVRVYDWNGTAWVQAGADLDGDSADDAFGSSVALSADGDRLVAGGPSSAAVADPGHVSVFDWNGSAWVSAGVDLVGEADGDRFGRSVAISADGDRIAVGATGSDAAGSEAGHVRVFDWSGSAWIQAGSDIDGLAAGDYAGTAVAISGDGSHVVMGATSSAINGEYSGYAKVFAWSGSAWVAVGSTIEGAAGDELGSGLALTNDGSRLAVGSYYAEGAFEDDGVTRLYEFADGAWVQQGEDIDGTSAYEQSGFSLAMTPDGGALAIGAVGFDTSAGQVRVFDIEWPAELPPLEPIPANVVLSAGQAYATVAGAEVPVTLTRVGSTVRLTGGDFSMDLTGLDELGTSGALDANGNLILRAGGFANVSGDGFAPNSQVQVYLFSTPTLLGTVDTDAEGAFEATLPIPVSTPPGTHTVQANGYTADGDIRSLNVGVVVPSAELLPPTGGSWGGLAVAATVLSAGLALITLGRRMARGN